MNFQWSTGHSGSFSSIFWAVRGNKVWLLVGALMFAGWSLCCQLSERWRLKESKWTGEDNPISIWLAFRDPRKGALNDSISTSPNESLHSPPNPQADTRCQSLLQDPYIHTDALCILFSHERISFDHKPT